MADLNRVKQRYQAGLTSFGTYVTLQTPSVVEVAAMAGLDFVRLDALEAGKEVSLLHSLAPDGIERTLRWIEQGVRILTVDSDSRVLVREYAAGLEQLRRIK